MAYLKLMMDEKEIAHLSEDGQSLCANEGVPQDSLPLNLFIGDKRKVPLVDVVVWAKKRIFPKNRMDCKEILKLMGVTTAERFGFVELITELRVSQFLVDCPCKQTAAMG